LPLASVALASAANSALRDVLAGSFMAKVPVAI